VINCGKCDNSPFELEEFAPRQSRFKFNAIKCTSCSTIVGAVDYFPAGAIARAIAEKLGAKLP
jgi:hypothetical protein